MNRTRYSVDRQAFTLVELLVVLAILAVLFALSTSAVMRFYGAGSSKVTQSTLQLVNRLLDTQWRAVGDKANREAIPSAAQANVDALAAGDDVAALRARVLYVKLRQKHAFPMNFAEVYSPYIPAFRVGEYQAYLDKLGYSASNQAGWPGSDIQNAVCLLMILEIGPGGTGVNNSELTNLGKILTNNGNTPVRGLVDGYGKPLVFSRVPTGFANLPTTAPLDSADPQRYLAASGWPAANKTLAQTALSVAGQPLTLPYTRQMKPVVASMGDNGLLGLDRITFAVTNAVEADDNKYTTNY